MNIHTLQQWITNREHVNSNQRHQDPNHLENLDRSLPLLAQDLSTRDGHRYSFFPTKCIRPLFITYHLSSCIILLWMGSINRYNLCIRMPYVNLPLIATPSWPTGHVVISKICPFGEIARLSSVVSRSNACSIGILHWIHDLWLVHGVHRWGLATR